MPSRWGTSYFTPQPDHPGKEAERGNQIRAEMGRNSHQQTQQKRHSATGMAEDHSPGYSDAKKLKSLCHPGTLEGPKYEVEWKASSGCLGSPAAETGKREQSKGAGIQRVSSEVRQAPHVGWAEHARARRGPRGCRGAAGVRAGWG